MLAEAINQSAGVGVGVFLGSLLGLTVHKRAGRGGTFMLKESVLFTALVAGMVAWVCFAALRLVIGF
ncbi:hypothetical protein [Citreimonas salinaria]|uniref:Uncharacterized protein n=1 Tax=Citreimonas salinaria TaxID=321339 RepID=A0A1H3G6A5_9RHOB|nr:hypothetical protein [Citreimonas salinaria]SDX98014.1 hypothetical protein SAMN05444340_102147 [Citreimonas salinaria]